MSENQSTMTPTPFAAPAGAPEQSEPRGVEARGFEPRGVGRAGTPTSNGGAALRTEHGVTTIASSVVAKIAGMATQEIPGVQAMGTSLSRAFGSIRSKVPGGGASATTQGVSVEVGERQAAIDIDIVVYYGQSIVETADAIRQNVIERIEGMTSLEVVEVNISVADLYIDGEDDNSSSRVE